MKIVQINSFSNGSTGNIMMSIHKEILKQGHDSYVVWGRGRKNKDEHEIYLDDKFGVYCHVLYSRLTGKTGFLSKKTTKILLKKLDKIKPDIIHLHNIHGYYINIEMLFNYIKKNNIKVVWTLHDCWSFTGQCPHFIIAKCDKWETECKNCQLIHEYPKSFKDNSNWNYKKKKELFTNVNMKIITPSQWLASLVKKSFLDDYSVEVINNGIDLNIFKPTISNFREKYNLNEKKIILGVAGVWTWKKGLNDFLELSRIIDDNYRIVLIGLNKKQIKKMPKNIIGIEKTENQQELAEIYTAANVFLNLTYEDNYPTVNLEAISCGTPVLTYETGGSSEFSKYIISSNYDYVINKNQIKNKEILKRIDELINKKISINYDGINVDNMVNKYYELYLSLK